LNNVPRTHAEFHLDAYLVRLRSRGKAEGTIVKYRQILSEFVAWVGDREWDEISAADIDGGFLAEWATTYEREHGRPPMTNTVRLRITTLKSFYEYLERMDYVLRNPMRKIDAPAAQKRVNDWLRPMEDQALQDNVQTPEERIIIFWLRFTGCRYCEGEHSRNRDIDLSPTEAMPYGSITIRTSKTVSGIRVIPILPELRPEIDRWRKRQEMLGHDAPDMPFLGTRNGTPMSHTFVWRIVKRVAHRADVRRQKPPDKSGWNKSKVSPHTLRRTLGSSLINQGKPLNVVSKMLGHSSTTITERAYAELTNEQIAAQVLAI
jgi:site-specific recombinase XerD